jgi:hypothetical protein
MSNRVKSLAVQAKQQISICCETLCDREVVEQYIQQLEDRIKGYENERKEQRHWSHDESN